jgi:hypothetical protein
MLNSLNFRPTSGPQYEALADACCQHIRLEEDVEVGDEDDYDTTPLGYHRGIYFLADIVSDDLNHTWRVPISVSAKVDEVYLTWFYGRASMANLEHDAGIDRVLAPKDTVKHQSRIPNKQRKTIDIQFVRGPGEEIDADNINLQLADRGVTVRPLAREGGRDVEEHQAHLYREPEEPVKVGADDTVSDIWKQVPYDIFAVAPNGARTKDPSHILMSTHARRSVTWDIFKTTNLTAIFEKVQIRMVDDVFWTTTLFDRYFPPKGANIKERGKLQNFPYTTYYHKWTQLMTQLSGNDSKVVRAGLLTEFQKIKWLPHGGSDRMWATKKMTSLSWKIYPIGSKSEPCPQIAVNIATWNREPITLGIRSADVEEENEEDED